MNTIQSPLVAGDELRLSTAQQAEGLSALCRAHYRTAERIMAVQLWDHAVKHAAGAVGASHLPYRTLVQRASEIVLRGALYSVRRHGRIITFGASLIDDGAYVPLCSRLENPS